MLRVDPRVGADQERPLAALVVGRKRHELEDAADVTVSEAGLEEPRGGRVPDETLGAGARVDAPRLDADDAADPGRGGGGDADQGRDLLRRQPCDGGASLEGV